MSAVDEALRRAETLLEARDEFAALAALSEAERLGADPDRCGAGRWLISMLAGDFEAAWRASDTIRARGTPDEHRFWQGEDLRSKRAIVRSLHGFGDAVQMLRFAPALAERAASVLYEVPPRFVEIARCFPGITEVITWGEGAPAEPPAWDVQVEVMELPYLLRITVAQLPWAANYLNLPDAEVVRVRTAMGGSMKPRVGLVWTCGEWNISRSLPEELVSSMLLGNDIDCWSLASSEYQDVARRLALKDANAICGDGLLALAATIANLDLVVTVDTLAAHLAGALGKPVWLMLQHAADWRWMAGRDDSPWYPTMRLFRQSEQGDWTSVASRVREELHGFKLPAAC